MPEVMFQLPKDITRIWELPVPIVNTAKTNNKVKAYLTGTIEDPYEYNELCYLLDTASEDTTIDLYINTPGGVIDSAMMIAEAIKTSKANIVGHLSGTVASAGTIIAMMCDSLDVASHLSFMVHNYSGGMHGKGNEMRTRQQFVDNHLNTAFKDFYAGFLTDEEIEKVISDSDIWMGTEEVLERWSKRVEYLKGVSV